MACPVNAAQNIFCAGGHNADMGKKRKNKGGAQALHAGMVSANEYTGFVQHIPVSNEDIELFRRMYGGGSFNSDDIGS